mgnify:CR=1 FL=1
MRVHLWALFVALFCFPASSAFAQFVPNDPLYDAWDSTLITSPSAAPAPVPADPGQWNLRAIRADEAWEITRGDSDVVIAVIATPFRLDHADLIGAL